MDRTESTSFEFRSHTVSHNPHRAGASTSENTATPRGKQTPPTVLIAGIPVPNFPDPMHKLFEKLKAKFGKKASSSVEDEELAGCKDCKS